MLSIYLSQEMSFSAKSQYLKVGVNYRPHGYPKHSLRIDPSLVSALLRCYKPALRL